MRLRTIRRRFSMFLMLGFLGNVSTAAQNAPTLNLMPWPASVQPGSGSLKIDSSFGVAFTGHNEARLDRVAERFLTMLRKQTGLLIAGKPVDSSKAKLVVHTDHASKEVQELGEDESYTLAVTSTGAKLEAANPLGVLRGLQT